MGWLERYLALAQHTEPPPIFHQWCAIAGVGHVLGRRVWLEQEPIGTIYPGQMMVLLCSDAAISRKTTAMRMVIRFFEKLPTDRWNVIPQRVTGATLIDALYRDDDDGNLLDAVGLIFAEELGTFFSREQARQDLPTLVTELNDAAEGEWKAPTRKYGNIVLKNPCVGMVAGTTPTGLAHEVPQQVRRTGFLSRCITVQAEGAGKACPLTDPPPGYWDDVKWLWKDMWRMSELHGPFTWSSMAKKWYNQWYMDHFARWSTAKAGDGGWIGRKHTHLLRTSMILTAMHRSELVLYVDVLEEALRMLDHVQQHLGDSLREVGVDPMVKSRKDVLWGRILRWHEKLPKGHWMGQKWLYQRCYHKYYEFHQYGKGTELFRTDLSELEAQGRVESRWNTDGKQKEWRVVQTKGMMLKGVE